MTATANREALDRDRAVQKPLDKEQKRVLKATLIGTTVEWYDFFIYANAAAIIFAAQFFGPLGDESPQLAQLISYLSVGISFVFRPLGAVFAGWLGDRYGRKIVLVITLGLMGLATCLMGLLPTYAAIGVWAPILLIVLRILQGVSAGGEWGGAALMAVEHAPVSRRGLFGAYPQIGVPLGMLLATAVLGLLSWGLSDEQFESWGWRVPFVLSLVLIVVGFYIRSKVSESPVFQQMNERAAHTRTPLKQLLKDDGPTVIKAALSFVGNNAAGYMVTGGFILGYTTTELGSSRDAMLLIVSCAAAFWIATTLFGGVLSDKIGRRRTYLIGYALQIVWVIPLFLIVDTGNYWWITAAVMVFVVSTGLTYGPQSAMFAELFPSRIRFSGVSISYAIGAILGGAFAPTIAQLLVNETGWIGSVGVYLMLAALISVGALLSLKEPQGAPLTPSDEDAARELATGTVTATGTEAAEQPGLHKSL